MYQTGSAPCAAPTPSAAVLLSPRQRAALARFDELAHRSGNLGSILQKACQSAAEGVDAEFVRMLQYRADEQAFVLQAEVGMQAGLVGRARIAAGLDTTAGRAWHANQLVHFRRFPAESRIRAPGAMIGQDVLRLVSLPVPGEDETAFGVLEVGTAEAGEFAERDLLFLQALANGVGTAVRRHADWASWADRAVLAAERRRAVRYADGPAYAAVLNAGRRHQGSASSGLQQDTQIPAGGD